MILDMVVAIIALGIILALFSLLALAMIPVLNKLILGSRK